MTIPLTQQAHTLLREHVRPGDVVIDATAGNGHDTVLLAELVGNGGHVFAFDIQAAAIRQTQQRLSQVGLGSRVTLIESGHEQMARFIPASTMGQVSTVVFNLGYLPGGDKTRITQVDTTLTALAESIRLLATTGLVSLIAYPGHPGGREEAEAIRQWASRQPGFHCQITVPPARNAPPPEWIVLQRH